jgi:hypothetical protein
MISDTEANQIVDGIQSGDVDSYDLQSLILDYEVWVKESESHTARLIRENKDKK